MKVVYYHADSRALWGAPAGLYERIAGKFLANCESFGLEVIHLTLDGHAGWGHRTIRYSGLDHTEIVYNLEVCFANFLRDAEPGAYLFTEPDSRLLAPIPPSQADCVLLYRHESGPHLCPALRVATPAALPIFERMRDAIEPMPTDRRAWHGDSIAFESLYQEMAAPTRLGQYAFGGVSIELRGYTDYMKGPVMRFWKNSSKLEMVE